MLRSAPTMAFTQAAPCAAGYQPPPGRLFFLPTEPCRREREQVWGPSTASRSCNRGSAFVNAGRGQVASGFPPDLARTTAGQRHTPETKVVVPVFRVIVVAVGATQVVGVVVERTAAQHARIRPAPYITPATATCRPPQELDAFLTCRGSVAGKTAACCVPVSSLLCSGLPTGTPPATVRSPL